MQDGPATARPPRPSVPKGSLKVIWTLAMKFLFQMSEKILLANLSAGGGGGQA